MVSGIKFFAEIGLGPRGAASRNGLVRVGRRSGSRRRLRYPHPSMSDRFVAQSRPHEKVEKHESAEAEDGFQAAADDRRKLHHAADRPAGRPGRADDFGPDQDRDRDDRRKSHRVDRSTRRHVRCPLTSRRLPASSASPITRSRRDCRVRPARDLGAAARAARQGAEQGLRPAGCQISGTSKASPGPWTRKRPGAMPVAARARARRRGGSSRGSVVSWKHPQ